MAKYSAAYTSVTPEARADTSAMTSDAYCALKGGSSTQRVVISEVYIGGEETTSSKANILVLGRHSTIATTPSASKAKALALLDGSATAPGTLPTAFTSAATGPQRDTNQHLLKLSFNAYGGIVRWVAAPGSEISVVGNTASLGELSLSGFTGSATGPFSAHFIIEVV